MQAHPYGALPRRQRRYGRHKTNYRVLGLIAFAAVASVLAGLGAPHI